MNLFYFLLVLFAEISIIKHPTLKLEGSVMFPAKGLRLLCRALLNEGVVV